MEEKQWAIYKIWKSHSTFKCSRTAVVNPVNKVKKTGSRARLPGSGRRVTIATEETQDGVEELIC